jgi:DNA replication protein DnaC
MEQAVPQLQPKAVEKISTKPIFEPDGLRALFLQVLNKLHLESSGGKRGLVLDDETAKVVELMCQYINREASFESAEGRYSFSKGILLMGNFGSGKTQLMSAYRIVMNQLHKEQFENKVGMVTCESLNKRYLEKDEWSNERQGFKALDVYIKLQNDWKEMIFDDLGSEETTIVDFGNRVCVMAHVLSERYNKFQQGMKTHVTTNESSKDLEIKYGGRIASRVFEMFNVIKLGSKADSVDYRKEKY